ncbi:endonuclease 8-like 1 [Actinia tenebrosa]|uniref:Endonuclease 8-like 1 n=1 Tax=Actinia tenebrosa TaxID=6105 RepID=A0A6P8H4M9_ACTTE|nr:endonuclease 8-like 1 [Actinia tenebrosa]XP_031551309.1 endonuclease 8-like 1 [Actinia tenebrosa]
MPEGPELYKTARLVNTVCAGRVFHGKIVKSAVNQKNPEIHHNYDDYTIQAESCGKEMALILKPYSSVDSKELKKMKKETNSLRILFRFGMSGKFQFTSMNDIHKHAHLRFFTKEKPKMVLSFVDVRRFGRWETKDSWSENRGPDPILHYEAFRDNVLNNLENPVFNKPLCEVMHDQKYFNGIGNYLRAEIIYRADIPPFTAARKVLANLKVKEEASCDTKNLKEADILKLCNIVPNEVIQLSGAGYDPSGNHSDYSAFMNWLQCYSNPNMKNLIDHDGRTMWFKGEAGPLAPKGGKTRTARRYGKHKTKSENEEHQKKKVKPELEKKPSVKKERKSITRKGTEKSDNKPTASAVNLRKRKLSTTEDKVKEGSKKRATSKNSVLESSRSEKVPRRAVKSGKGSTATRRLSKRKKPNSS